MTHEHASEVKADKVHHAVDFTATAISKRYGLDVERIRRVLERTEYRGLNWADYRDGDDLYAYLFVPSIVEALDYLQPETALALFEKEDLELLNKRVTAIQYLFGRLAPLYSLSELEQLTKLFISYLERNRDHILKVGLPGQPFEESPLLETLLSPLYFFKQPISSHLAKSNENGDTLYKYMWGSGNDWKAVKECSYEEAPFLEILAPLQVRYLIKSRSKLFELKIQILLKLIESLHTGETTNLVDNCLWLVAQTLTEDEMKSFIKMDSLYIEAKVYPGRDHILWHRPVTGGITDLLEIIGHYDKELNIGTFAKTKEALGRIISFERSHYELKDLSKAESPYFEYVALGLKNDLDKALDLFLSLQTEEETYWAEYRPQVRRALDSIFKEQYEFAFLSYGLDETEDEESCTRAASKLSLETDSRDKVIFREVSVCDVEGDESSRIVTIKRTVPAEYADLLDQNLHYFAELFMWHILNTGRPPKPPQLYPMLMPTLTENVFRKEGDFWRITFANKPISLKDNKGLKYIAFLLSHPRKEYPVLDLVSEVDGLPVELVDKGCRKRKAKDLPHKKPAGDNDQDLPCAEYVGAIYDEQDKKKIKEELDWLNRELAEALQNNDLERASRLREEKESILEYLSKASNVFGRSRQFSDEGEKARKRVAAAIRRALEAIEKQNTDLWRHLNSYINTGYSCSYEPSEDFEWSF